MNASVFVCQGESFGPLYSQEGPWTYEHRSLLYCPTARMLSITKKGLYQQAFLSLVLYCMFEDKS